MRRSGFTLIEVNLAIGALAVGLVSIMALFSFSFKEGRQSCEDVQTAAASDAIFSPIVMAVSSTNLVWSKFRELECYPKGAETKGWGVYIGQSLGKTYLPVNNPTAKANEAIQGFLSELAQCADGNAGFPTSIADPAGGDLRYGVLIQHDAGSPIVRLSFRASRNHGLFFCSPIYYTEVAFQGDPTK